MSCCYSQYSGNQRVILTTERLKVLKVIGEKIGQVIVENATELPAVKIDHIDASIKKVTDHIFTDKIVKQGIIHKQVFYVDSAGIVREKNEDVPFVLAVDIPGVGKDNPWLEIEGQVLRVETDYHLHHGDCHESAILKQKTVVDFLVKVSEWVQLDVLVKPRHCRKIDPMNTIVIPNQ